jgi:hypothetical protein
MTTYWGQTYCCAWQISFNYVLPIFKLTEIERNFREQTVPETKVIRDSTVKVTWNMLLTPAYWRKLKLQTGSRANELIVKVSNDGILNLFYWSSGLCLWSSFRNRTQRAETGYFHPQAKWWGVSAQLGPLERSNSNHREVKSIKGGFHSVYWVGLLQN